MTNDKTVEEILEDLSPHFRDMLDTYYRKKFVELLPKKKETEKLISFPEADFTSIRARLRGYNQCLDDIKKVLGEI